MQEGFAAPEDEEIDEQAHLDQDEYWVLPSLPFLPLPPFLLFHVPILLPLYSSLHFGIIPPLHAVDISSIASVSMDAPYVLSMFVYFMYYTWETQYYPLHPQTIASAVIYPSRLSMFYITTWRMNTYKASGAEGSTMDFKQEMLWWESIFEEKAKNKRMLSGMQLFALDLLKYFCLCSVH